MSFAAWHVCKQPPTMACCKRTAGWSGTKEGCGTMLSGYSISQLSISVFAQLHHLKLQITIYNTRRLDGCWQKTSNKHSPNSFIHSVIKLLVITLQSFSGGHCCCDHHCLVKYSHCESVFDFTFQSTFIQLRRAVTLLHLLLLLGLLLLNMCLIYIYEMYLC